jgi:two-component system, sensor histidine kinase and response regulator
MTKILVIEDERALLEEVMDVLGFEGYETIGAENGRIGVQLAKEQQPDLIISDIMMPELDGYGVLLELHADPETMTIPFIFVTAKAERQDMRKGMGYGANDYLVKPLSHDEILSSVRARLENQTVVTQKYDQQLDNLRSTLTHTIPHELRTPLMSILGFAEMLTWESTTLEPQRVAEMAEMIFVSGQRLHRIIENYLFYAQIEIMATDPEKKQSLRETQTPHPGDVIAKAAIDVATRVERENDLVWETENTPIQIDEDNLSKITEELVDNAFKFSQAGTEVRVTAAVTGDTYRLCVDDNGRGLSVGQIKSIGAYMQFDRALYEQQGSGMGLIIVNRLAELVGGKLVIESALKQGTKVCVELPIANTQ